LRPRSGRALRSGTHRTLPSLPRFRAGQAYVVSDVLASVPLLSGRSPGRRTPTGLCRLRYSRLAAWMPATTAIESRDRATPRHKRDVGMMAQVVEAKVARDRLAPHLHGATRAPPRSGVFSELGGLRYAGCLASPAAVTIAGHDARSAQCSPQDDFDLRVFRHHLTVRTREDVLRW
jgi:hypothetical protein